MALFNYANREITAKIVYYGPGVCGKTTSLQYIHERIAPDQRGRLLSLATETDRTIFFDLLPLKVGEIRGFKLRFQLYTVPGQVKYNQTRKLVLQGADAIVFVADSQVSCREANVESFKNLQDNLKEQGKTWEDMPLVYEFNKRDLPNLLSIEDLNRDLNARKLPYFPTVATKGVGVMESLEAISKLALQDIESRLVATTTAGTAESTAEEEFAAVSESLDLAGGEELAADTSLTFSNEELDALNLESELDVFLGSGEKTLETKPIGYDNDIPIQEVEIQQENIAQTGTLKESEFFDLKGIEEQALRELDDFLEGKAGDEALSFGELGPETPTADSGQTEENLFAFVESPDVQQSSRFDGGDLDFSFSAEVPEAPDSEQAESLEISEPPSEESETIFDFSLEDKAPQPEVEETELTFSLEEEPDKELLAPQTEDFALDESPLTFDLEEQSPPSPASDHDELLEFNLEEEPEEPGLDQGTKESPLKVEEEPLELEATETLPSFALSEEDLRGESTPLSTEAEELVEFTLGEEPQSPEGGTSAFESSPKAEIESLDLSESDLDLAFGETETSEEKPSFDEFEAAEEAPDFRITDSVKFEMQHGEEISSVTPFEKQLDELSEDMFTTEEKTSAEEFQPETSETAQEEPFQHIADESTRLAVLAKHFYHKGEIYRAKQTVSDNILAIVMYYTAIETELKAAALKYETCNPTVASLKIVLDSLEEETGKTITGKKSILDNIVKIKNDLQLETVYPDPEGCELAARICERFLSTFAQDFLAVDFTALSPALAKAPEA
jgi:signal recognition particle receptor subunit beta